MNEAAILRTLNAFAVDVITIPSVDDLFWYVAQNVVGPLGFVDCVIYQANEAGTNLAQVAALGEKNPYDRSILNPLHIPFGQGITGQVAQSGKPMIVDDLLQQRNYIPDMQPARSEICVPLLIKGRVVGVIDSEHPDSGAFGQAELDILTTVAAMTSAKLELLAEAERSHQRYLDLATSHVQLSQETANRRALESKLFAARKLEAIGRLTGRFAHDFNNLLTVISGNLEFLAADVTSADGQASLADAQTAAGRGAKLIRDMLAFSQRTRLAPELADLNEIAANVMTHAAPTLPASITLTKSLSDSLALVAVDIRETVNALRNLISNARDAMSGGGILHIWTEMVTHSWHENASLVTPLAPGAYVCISVQDSGTGIPEDSLPQLFDPFYTTKPVGQGAGLGLSMILGFMQQSRGSVSVTSKLHEGSRFRLYFPIAQIEKNDLLTIDR
ncbi:ATP-binding protein [Pseudorhodobacter ferrugineus]|uniref:ATP-binding protein n=1 Tax=Pseudorhodobacter ferrugineus TaxID=77008 RepID=UPI0003B5DF72|nr:ATP-binding protein [Pseudorhodobacter ferrugineus]